MQAIFRWTRRYSCFSISLSSLRHPRWHITCSNQHSSFSVTQGSLRSFVILFSHLDRACWPSDIHRSQSNHIPQTLLFCLQLSKRFPCSPLFRSYFHHSDYCSLFTSRDQTHNFDSSVFLFNHRTEALGTRNWLFRLAFSVGFCFILLLAARSCFPLFCFEGQRPFRVSFKSFISADPFVTRVHSFSCPRSSFSK